MSESSSAGNELTGHHLTGGKPADELIDPEQQRVPADRPPLTGELAQQRLHELDAALREALGQRDDALRAAAELETRVHALTVQLDHQRSVAANAGRERDDYGMRLIEAEHRAAVIPEALLAADLAGDLAAARHRLSELEAELQLTRRTLSWRVTQPLRSLRTVVRSRGAR
jgi:hypothetical protein